MTCANAEIPPGLMTVLREFDFLGHDGATNGVSHSYRINLMVTDIRFEPLQGPMSLSAFLVRPEGGSAEMFRRGVFSVDADATVRSQRVYISFSSQEDFGSLKSDKPKTVIFCNARECFHDWRQDGADFMCDADTVWIRSDPQQHDGIHVFEAFAGGFGGWSCATRFLSTRFHKHASLHTIAIDSSMEAVASFAMTHECPIVDAYKPVPRHMFDGAVKNMILHGDMDSKCWWAAIGQWGIDVLTLSAPCPPWSGAARAQGLSSDIGMLLPIGILIARIFRPTMILVEQVQGFSTHKHRLHCVACFKHIGYTLKWHRVVDSADFGGARRARWLAVAVRQHAPTLPDVRFTMWPTITQLSPQTLGAIFQDPCPDHELMQLSDEVIAIACDPNMFPAFLKHKAVTPASVGNLRVRSTGADQVAATFMSMYGAQHRLDGDTLREKGYMGHFLQMGTHDSSMFRYFHPAEVAMIHLVTDRIFVDRDCHLAWSHMGNQISQPHAMLLLTHMLQCFAPHTHVNVEDIFMTMLRENMKASNTVSIVGSTGTVYVDSTSNFRSDDAHIMQQLRSHDQLRQIVGRSFLPDGQMWFPDRGFVDVAHGCELLKVFDHPICSQVSTGTEATEASDTVMDTCDFPVMLKVKLCAPDQHFFLWVSGSIDMPWLNVAFGLSMQPESIPQDDMGCSFHMHFPRGIGIGRVNVAPTEAIPILTAEALTVYKLNGAAPLMSQFADLAHHFQVDHWYDEYGVVEDDHKGNESAFLTHRKLHHGTLATHPMFLLAASHQTESSAIWDPATGTMRFEVTGDDTPCQVVSDFWSSMIPDDTLAHLGLQKDFSRIASGLQVVFKPITGGFLLPPHVIEAILVVAAARVIMDSMASENGHVVTLKWGKKIIWQGLLHPGTTVGVLVNLMDVAYLPFRGEGMVRLVCKGRTFHEVTIQEVHDMAPHQSIVMHLVFGLCGGTGAKDQQRTYVKNTVAATLLESGFALDWTSKAVETLLSSVGLKKLTQLVAMPSGKARCDQIIQLCKDSALQVPQNLVSKAAQVTAKGDVTTRARKRQVVQPSPSDYTLDTGYLLNEDNTHPQQLPELLPNCSGIVLVDLETATPWIRENKVLSHDELCLAIIGTHTLPCSLKQAHASLPCRDARGNAVILATTLCQLGEKSIKSTPSETHIHEANCVTVAMTLWREDWQEGEWDKILQQPIPFVRNLLAKQGHDQVLESVWGKSVRGAQKDHTVPYHAVSLQLHGAIKQESIHEVLRNSGFNKLYMVPKTAEGRLSPDWKVVWVDGNRAHLTTLSTQTPHCEGLVRSQKSWGLRYSKANFAAAWKQIHGDRPLPIDIATTMLYRVQPLPYGTTAEMLHQWSKSISWEFRALKALGPRAWMVGAPAQPGKNIYTFNSTPVLIHPITQRDAPKAHPILAGPKPQRPSASKATSSDDPWLSADPWKGYQGVSNTPGVAASSAAPRPLAGPVEAKFSAHEERLSQVEKALDQLKQDTKQGFQQVEQQVEQRDLRMHTAMTQMRSDLEASFQNTISQQSQQLNSTLADLKQLLTRPDKRSIGEAEQDSKME
eukprot:Skav215505  [mRNA]  locus=scaffold165:950597:955276:- [translate_table: standard]